MSPPSSGGHALVLSNLLLFNRVWIIAVSILIEHVSQDVLGVFKTFDHFEIGTVHCTSKRISSSLSPFINIGNNFSFRAQHDLSVVLKINLDNFIRQSKHNCMAGAHPFFNVDDVCNFTFGRYNLISWLFIWFWFGWALQVTSEVLQQSYLLLECWRVLNYCVLFANILPIGGPSFNVVEVETVRIKHNFSCIVEEHTHRLVAQVVSKPVFAWIIDPLLDPDLFLNLSFDFFLLCIWSSHWTTLTGLTGIVGFTIC